MTETSSNLTRRKFLIASSAAIASPLLLNVAGPMVGAKTAEAMTVTNVIKGKGKKIYYIGHGCVGCHVCMAFCPAGAVRFGDTGNEIDQNKCIHCGTCYNECPICVISETEF